jgi:hypothetical protein
MDDVSIRFIVSSAICFGTGKDTRKVITVPKNHILNVYKRLGSITSRIVDIGTR